MQNRLYGNGSIFICMRAAGRFRTPELKMSNSKTEETGITSDDPCSYAGTTTVAG